MKKTTLLLFSALLSGCASAPQQTANTCPVDAKAAPVDAKPTQFVLKPITLTPKAPYDIDKINKSLQHCDDLSKWCAYALREKMRGTPMEKVLHASDKTMPGLHYEERRLYLAVIYKISREPVPFIAGVRSTCLNNALREQLTAKAP